MGFTESRHSVLVIRALTSNVKCLIVFSLATALISNVLFFIALLWFNQTNRVVVEALLDLSDKQNLSILNLEALAKDNTAKIKRLVNGEIVKR